MKKYLPIIYNDSNTLVIQLIWREAQLHALWHEAKQSNDPPTTRYDLQVLLKTALDLDLEYEAWESMLPPIWGYRVQPNTPEVRSTYDVKWQKLLLESKGAPGEIYIHPSLKKSWIWGFCRTSRMFLLRDTLEILNWMFRLPEPSHSSSHSPVESMRGSANSDADTNSFTTSFLDTDSLRRQYTLSTAHLVDVIEKACCAIFGNFIVPVKGRSFEDMMGMRGYVCVWPLGTMDSILSSGLVPDAGASALHSEPRYDQSKTLPMTPDTSQAAQSPPQSFYHDTSMVRSSMYDLYETVTDFMPVPFRLLPRTALTYHKYPKPALRMSQ